MVLRITRDTCQELSPANHHQRLLIIYRLTALWYWTKATLWCRNSALCIKGDRSRKETLVEYGFRLPSAMDNRPLKFEEFLGMMPQARVCVGDAR